MRNGARASSRAVELGLVRNEARASARAMELGLVPGQWS